MTAEENNQTKRIYSALFFLLGGMKGRRGERVTEPKKTQNSTAIWNNDMKGGGMRDEGRGTTTTGSTTALWYNPL